MDEHCIGAQAIALTNFVEKSHGNCIAKCVEVFVADPSIGAAFMAND